MTLNDRVKALEKKYDALQHSFLNKAARTDQQLEQESMILRHEHDALHKRIEALEDKAAAPEKKLPGHLEQQIDELVAANQKKLMAKRYQELMDDLLYGYPRPLTDSECEAEQPKVNKSQLEFLYTGPDGKPVWRCQALDDYYRQLANKKRLEQEIDNKVMVEQYRELMKDVFSEKPRRCSTCKHRVSINSEMMQMGYRGKCEITGNGVSTHAMDSMNPMISGANCKAWEPKEKEA